MIQEKTKDKVFSFKGFQHKKGINLVKPSTLQMNLKIILPLERRPTEKNLSPENVKKTYSNRTQNNGYSNVRGWGLEKWLGVWDQLILFLKTQVQVPRLI